MKVIFPGRNVEPGTKVVCHLVRYSVIRIEIYNEEVSTKGRCNEEGFGEASGL